MSSPNKLIVVTSPNYYHADVPSIMLYDLEPEEIRVSMMLLLEADIHMSLHLGYTEKSDRDWLLNTSRQVDHVIVNLEKHDLTKGFILNYPTVSYYNSKHNLEALNVNRLDDPLDYILRFVHEQKRNSE